MFCRAKIWLEHPSLFLNPACSFLSVFSAASDIRLMTIIVLIFAWNWQEGSYPPVVAVYQGAFLSHLYNSSLWPVIWNFLSYPQTCEEGTEVSIPQPLDLPWQFCIEVILARGLSFLERPYNFICFFFDGGSVFMSSSASASVVSASIARAGLFSTSLTYSAHQASCSASILSSRLICPWWGHHWFQSSCRKPS